MAVTVRPHPITTVRQATAFVRKHGIVLEAGSGPVPSLAEAVAQGPIKGSWWSHARGKLIFALTRALRDSDDILVCRAAKGKVTYVHRRAWPALVRLSDRLPRERIAQIKEVHSSSGRHVIQTTAFPKWVSREVSMDAKALSESEAMKQVGRLFS